MKDLRERSADENSRRRVKCINMKSSLLFRLFRIRPLFYQVTRLSSRKHIDLSNTREQKSKYVLCILFLYFSKLLSLGVTHANSFALRSHTCGELRKSDVGRKVKLSGWVQFQRLNKFVLLRDAYGVTQLMVPDEV